MPKCAWYDQCTTYIKWSFIFHQVYVASYSSHPLGGGCLLPILRLRICWASGGNQERHSEMGNQAQGQENRMPRYVYIRVPLLLHYLCSFLSENCMGKLCFCACLHMFTDCEGRRSKSEPPMFILTVSIYIFVQVYSTQCENCEEEYS